MKLKRSHINAAWNKLLICLAIGLVVTLLSGLYGRTVLHQHCSTPGGSDSDVIQCSLEGTERGLPFAYVLPHLPNSQFKLSKFVDDILVWSVIPGIFMLKSNRKVSRG